LACGCGPDFAGVEHRTECEVGAGNVSPAWRTCCHTYQGTEHLVECPLWHAERAAFPQDAESCRVAPDPAPHPPLVRRFELVRDQDLSGVSGTGVVADGVQFGSGWVAIHWRGAHPSVGLHPSLESVEAVHGHDGATRIVWVDAA
jgi:hypothetical protein